MIYIRGICIIIVPVAKTRINDFIIHIILTVASIIILKVIVGYECTCVGVCMYI